MAKIEAPKGIPFFSIKSGDTHFARTSAQIQAYINSSDMGINASRGQDFGWRLAADWVNKVKDFRKDVGKMERLAEKYGGADPTTPQILFAIYSEDVRAHERRKAEEENPYEGEYLQKISGGGVPSGATQEQLEAEAKKNLAEAAKSNKVGGVDSKPVTVDVETKTSQSQKSTQKK